MNDNTNKQAVVDAIWANPSTAFNVQFKGGGRRWDTVRTAEAFALLKTADGTNIYVHFNHGHPMAGQKPLDVFTYLGEYVLKTSGFKDTLLRVAESYNLTLNFTAEEKKTLGRQVLARELAASLVEALRLNPEGTAARYLRDVRGLEPNQYFGELTAESVKAAKESLTRRGISYTVEDFEALGITEYHAKQGFNLVIPHRLNGQIKDFVLRNVRPADDLKNSNTPKIWKTQGSGRGGWCDLLEIGQPAVVVEGEMDAIRLIQAGVKNVVAIGGPKIGEEIAKLFKARNISQVTYIPDYELDKDDTQKTGIIAEAIKAFQNARVDGQPVITNLYVAELSAPQGVTPDEWKQRVIDNKRKMDADDYGKHYGKNELLGVIEYNAVASWQWELDNLIKWGLAQDVVNFGVFQQKFNEIYTRTASPYERQRIRDYVDKGEYSKGFKAFGVTPQALTDIDEWNKATEYNDRIKDGLNDLTKAVAEGANPVKVAEIVGRLSEAQATNTREEWALQLAETFEDELQAIREQHDALRTKWELGNVNKNGEYFKYSNIEFWPADISIVCAVSSHGKTTFLVQSALDMVARYPDKTFLYVSCEENKRQLTERVLNTYLNIQTTDTGKDDNGEYCFIRQTRKKTIKAVIRGSVPPEEYNPYMGVSGHYNALSRRINEGLRRYAAQVRPRLKLVHTEASTESICNNVRYFIDQMAAEGVEVGGVFVDYMQLLTTENRNFSRHDELKDICKALKECAAKTEIPFVIAAQLNREGISEGIDSITMANIGEGADIERIAHDIYFIWQIDKTKVDTYFKNKKTDGKTDGKTDSNQKDKIWNYDKAGDRANRIFTNNPCGRELKSNHLYVEHLKARDGKTGGWGLLEWDGESGRIGVNDKAAMRD